jgi:hypothetical protein
LLLQAEAALTRQPLLDALDDLAVIHARHLAGMRLCQPLRFFFERLFLLQNLLKRKKMKR